MEREPKQKKDKKQHTFLIGIIRIFW